MSSNFVQNATLRSVGLGAYRLYAQAMFWRTGPKVMINSIPKAGTHLLTTYVQNSPSLMDAHLHIQRWDVLKLPTGAPTESWDRVSLRDDRLHKLLRTVRGGQIVTGHLYYLAAANEVFASQGFRVVNLVRNPRDMLVSRLHYILGLKRHHLHHALADQYPDGKSRLKALIVGPDAGKDNVGGLFRPYRTMLEGFVGWTDAPDVLTLRYEDLVGAKGGGDRKVQEASLSRFFEHVGQPMSHEKIAEIIDEGAAQKSATLRKGRIGDWRETFDDEIEALFQAEVGDVAKALGY